MVRQPLIEELGLISDRNTCAIVDRAGVIVWHCPERFDGDAVLSSLIDIEQGGFWAIASDGMTFLDRRYVDNGGALETRFSVHGRGFTLKDWLPLAGTLRGLCRAFSAVPEQLTSTLRLRKGYGEQAMLSRQVSPNAVINVDSTMFLKASHTLRLVGDAWVFSIPAGESGWAILSTTEGGTGRLGIEDLTESATKNAEAWQVLSAVSTYDGPYQRQVKESTRVVQQLTYEASGGVLAAATSSLPEVIQGTRNYDYRYVWTRDISLVVSAMTQVAGISRDGRRALKFILDAGGHQGTDAPAPLYRVDQSVLTENRELDLAGYYASRPVRIGNAATDQLQLDAIGNVLLAAKLIYDREPHRFEWTAITKIADFLANHWHRDDHGIWEEESEHGYTSSKVFAARGLEFMAAFSENSAQAECWINAARQIRAFVAERCMTKSGAFAVYAGSEEVDVTAALFPLWSYVESDSPVMLATIKEIERHLARGALYWRRLDEFDSRKEGAFLAASCWMAHYYAVAGDVQRTQRILDAVLEHQNDLGIFAEEGGIDGKPRMLGNFPQTFVHSSFICAVNGLKAALAGRDSCVR